MTLGWWLACAPAVPVRPDVVLVTLDTTRADRLGAYGYGPARTPELDALAARGTRFERALSPVPLTIPAHASLFTGRYPPRLGIRANGDASLPLGLVTLPERFHDAGYATGASVAAFVTSRAWGFGQGFDVFSDPVDSRSGPWHAERPGSEVVDDVLAWEAETREGAAPRFAWVHLYDPHFPHEGGYDAEIARVDEQVGRVLDAFDRRPTLVVVVGDHGESLGEHGELLHGWHVYEATQRVPWLMAGPGVPEGVVVSEAVSLVDVGPTLLALAGVEPLPASDGRVVPGAGERLLYAEAWQLTQRFGLAPALAVVEGRYKLIARPRPELYDVVADPLELDDQAPFEPARLDRMTAALNGLGFAPPTNEPGRRPDPDLVQRLVALGYVEPAASLPAAPLPDPKDHEALLLSVQALDRLVMQQRWSEAEQALATLSGRYPDVPELVQRRAWVLQQLGRDADAIALMESALARAPEDATLSVALAGQLASQGQFARAAELYTEAAEVLDWWPQLRTMALRARLDAGQVDTAIEHGRAWLEARPEPSVAGLTGIALLQRRRISEALPLLEVGAVAEVPEAGVLYHLSAAAAGRGRRAEARALLEAELLHHPAHVPAVVALVGMTLTEGEVEVALEITAEALLHRPDDPVLLAQRARALAVAGRSDEARVAMDRALVRRRTRELLRLDAEIVDLERGARSGSR